MRRQNRIIQWTQRKHENGTGQENAAYQLTDLIIGSRCTGNFFQLANLIEHKLFTHLKQTYKNENVLEAEEKFNLTSQQISRRSFVHRGT